MLHPRDSTIHGTLQAYDDRDSEVTEGLLDGGDSEVVDGLPMKSEETKIQKRPKDCV